jgi:hypothetical protein
MQKTIEIDKPVAKTYRKKVHAVMGRPIEYPADSPIWDMILQGVSFGRSLSSVLRDPGLPTWPVVHAMLKKNEAFKDAYEKAVQERADRLADELLELADEEPPEGLEGPAASAWVQRKRLQVDTRKWIASKLKPRTYGDRIDVSVSDTRISVLEAIEQAQARVAIGMTAPDVTDVEPKRST